MTLLTSYQNLVVVCLGDTFTDIAIALADVLRDLGWETRTDMQLAPKQGEAAVVLGAFHDIETCLSLKDRVVVYNFEQLNVGSETVVVTDEYLDLMRQVEVWDYCKANIQWLSKTLGVQAPYIPLGYTKAFEKPEWRTGQSPDFDVLFYGGANKRRRVIMHHIEQAGVRVFLAKAYRSHLAKRIRASRLVVNIGFYQSGSILETARLVPLIASGVPVVTEARPGLEVPDNLKGLLFEFPARDLPSKIKALVASPRALETRAKSARDALMQHPWSEIIRQALGLEKSVNPATPTTDERDHVSTVVPDYFKKMKSYVRALPTEDSSNWGQPYGEICLAWDARASENAKILRKAKKKFNVPAVPCSQTGPERERAGVYKAFSMTYTHAIAEVANARLFLPQGGVTIPDEDLIIRESTWQARMWFHPNFRADASTNWNWRYEPTGAQPQRKIEELAWCYHQYHFQYYHWFIDCLPRYWLLKEAGLIDAPLYFGPMKPGTAQAQTLDIITPEHPTVKAIDQTVVDVERLRMPVSLLQESAKMRPSEQHGIHFKAGWDPHYLAWLYAHIVSAVHGENQADWQVPSPAAKALLATDGPLKLYLGRGRAAHRRVVGGAYLENWMQDQGYVVLEPADFSFYDQVRLFNRADRIVGVHGAALTNILWCDPRRKPKILELTVSGMDDPGYRMIAFGRAIAYAALPCEPVMTREGLGYADITVDVEAFKGAVMALDTL